eukprot:4549256-Karenia_brevis.AAC.1
MTDVLEPITVNELREQLKTMNCKKAPDQRGVVAELLKQSGDGFLKVVADVFTEILKPDSDIPDAWRETQLK